jgi:hypothetical protein
MKHIHAQSSHGLKVPEVFISLCLQQLFLFSSHFHEIFTTEDIIFLLSAFLNIIKFNFIKLLSVCNLFKPSPCLIHCLLLCILPTTALLSSVTGLTARVQSSWHSKPGEWLQDKGCCSTKISLNKPAFVQGVPHNVEPVTTSASKLLGNELVTMQKTADTS